MKLRLILINHFTAKVKNADLVDVRQLKRQNNNSYKKLIIISSTEREKDTASNNKSYFSSRCRQQLANWTMDPLFNIGSVIGHYCSR